MKGKRNPARFIALLVVSFLTLTLAIGQVAGQEPGPGVPDQGSTLYLPLVQRAPNTLYGHVTDNGAIAPGVSVQLWFFNGSFWDDIYTTTTDSNGDYRFTGMAALTAGQKYQVEFFNGSDPSRLWVWDTRELTSFPAGSVVNIGNFDIANVTLSAPAPGGEAALPRTFQWVPRPASPSDSYKFEIFDYYDNNPSFTSPSLGYTSSYVMSSLPPLFQYCNAYFWGIAMNSPDGGGGMSYYVYLTTLHQTALSGIHGCVTEDGVPRSGVQVKLYRLPDLTNWSATTNSGGYFQFIGKSALSGGQSYVVEYYNTSNNTRIGWYDTRDLESYTSGSSAFIGDFDVDNIVLGSPSSGAGVFLPETFFWTRRPAVTSDSYGLELFDLTYAYPYFSTNPLGYIHYYDLSGLPGGFAYDTPYGWSVWVDGPFGGFGYAFFYRMITFSSMAMSPAPAEAPVELQWEPQQLEAMRLERLGQSQEEVEAQWRQHPVFAGLRNAQAEP